MADAVTNILDDEPKAYSILDEVPQMEAPPVLAEGEDVSWWNKPLADVPELLGIARPDQVSDEQLDRVLSQMQSSAKFSVPTIGGMVSFDFGTDRMTPEAAKDAARLFYGGMYGAAEEISGLTTPLSLALIAGTAGTGKLAQVGIAKGVPLARKAVPWMNLAHSIMSYGFAAMMGKDIPEQFESVNELIEEAKNDPSKWAEVAREMTHIAVGTYGAAAGVVHGTKTLGESRQMLNRARELRSLEKAQVKEARRKAEVGIETEVGREVKTVEPKKELVDIVENHNKRIDSASPDEISRIKSGTIEQLRNEGHDDLRKIPVTNEADLVYDKVSGKFEVTDARMTKDNAWPYKQFKKSAQSSDVAWERIKNILDTETAYGRKRIRGDDYKLMRRRLSQIHDGLSDAEIAGLLIRGEVPSPVYDGILTDLSGLEKAKASFIMSGWTYLDKLGSVGKKTAEQLLQMELFVKQKIQRMDAIAQRVVDTFGKDHERGRRFMMDWEEANRTGVIPDNMRDIDALKAIDTIVLEEFKKMGAEYGLEILDPVTGKKASFAEATEGVRYHVPHMAGPKELKQWNTKPGREKLVELTMKKNPGMDKVKASKMVTQWLKNKKSGVRAGNLETKRVVNVDGWLADPRRKDFKNQQIRDALRMYIQQSVRRFGNLHFLEGKGSGDFAWNFAKAIEKVPDTDVAQLAIDMVQRSVGIENYDVLAPKWTRHLTDIQVVRKMGLSSLLNAAQTLVGTMPLAARNGFFRSWRDFGSVIKDMYQDKAFRRGGMTRLAQDMGEALNDTFGVLGNSFTSKLAEKYLSATGFTSIELFNRVFAERMGQRYAQHLMDFYHGRGWNPKLNRYYAEDPIARKQLVEDLRDLGVSQKSIDSGQWDTKTWAGRTLTEKEIAGQRFSRRTQFRSGPLDVPVKWQTNMGRLVFQFKNFSFNQARLVTNHVIKPFMRNPSWANGRVLLAWLGGTIGSNVAVMNAKRSIYAMINGDASQKEINELDLALSIIARESAAYYASDIFNSAQYGKTLEAVAGPTITDAARIVEGVVQGKPGKVAETTLPTPFNRLAK